MVDIVDPASRSRMMRGIRSKNTKPEMVVRRLLHARGFRYRLHDRKLPGTPDMVLPKYRAAIFVSGCFWHGHNCSLFRLPGTRPDFWAEKIGQNRARDVRSHNALIEGGWRYATIWECALRGKRSNSLEKIGSSLADWIRSNEAVCTIRGGV